MEREELLVQEARDVLFVDTNAITTYMFSLYYHGAATSRLTQMAVNAASRYDLVFVCDMDIPYADTWIAQARCKDCCSRSKSLQI